MSSDPVLRFVDQDRFEDWQRGLIHEKKYASSDPKRAARNQDDLERAVQAGPTPVRDYMLKKLGVDEAALSEVAGVVPALPAKLTVGEMQRLPIHAEKEIFGALGDVTRSQAAESAFWALCHAVWIGNWMFDNAIEAVFLLGGKDKTSEGRARNFLRRTGGLRRVRGHVSVLDNCPIARAWWRCQMTRAVSQEASEAGSILSEDTAHQVLWQSEVWQNLAGWSVMRATSLNAARAQAAVVVALAHQTSDANAATPRQQVQSVMRAVARAGHNHSLTGMTWDSLVGVAEEGLAHANQVATIDESDEEPDSG